MKKVKRFEFVLVRNGEEFGVSVYAESRKKAILVLKERLGGDFTISRECWWSLS